MTSGPRATGASIGSGGIFLLLIATGFFWGAGFPLIKQLDNAVPPVTLAAIRGAVAWAGLALWFLLQRESILPQSSREALDWFVIGSLNGWIANTLVNIALISLPAGQAAMIQASGPLITAVIAAAFFVDERLTPMRILGIAIGFAGAAMLIAPRLTGQGGSMTGVLSMLGVAVVYAVANVYVRFLKGAQPRRLALGHQTFSAIGGALLAWAAEGTTGLAPAGQYPGILLVLGLVATAIPIVLFMIILRTAGPTKGALAGCLVPAWAVILSALFLGEAIGVHETAAGAIILAGVYIVTRAKVHTA